MSEHVHCERTEHAHVVTIDRPDKLNALNTEIEDALYAEFERLAEEDATVVVIRTEGDAFIAGADLKEIRGMSTREFVEYQKNARETHDYIATHPAVVIAAVDGLAYGGGFEIALAADMIVAGTDATFAVPEVKLGLVPGGGATQRLPRLVGKNRAKELLTTGNPIDADEARMLGLANRVVPTEEVDEAAQELAAEIDTNAPLAVKEAKRLVNEGTEAALDTGLSYEQEVTFTLYQTADAAEGIDAFAEKRDPEFTGE
jgi:enoyl-CoA hydratase